MNYAKLTHNFQQVRVTAFFDLFQLTPPLLFIVGRRAPDGQRVVLDERPAAARAPVALRVVVGVLGADRVAAAVVLNEAPVTTVLSAETHRVRQVVGTTHGTREEKLFPQHGLAA